MVLYKILNNISSLSMVIPFAMLMTHFLFYTKKALPVVCYILLGVFFESYTTFLELLQIPLPKHYAYNFLETLIVGWVFYTFIKEKISQQIVIAVAILYVLTYFISWAINTVGTDKIIERGISTVACIIFCILYFLQLSSENRIKLWQMIVSGAFLFYFVTTTGMFSFISLFKGSINPKYMIYFALIHLVANCGLNCLLTLGLYKCKNQSF
jgi:hypothetical protein